MIEKQLQTIQTGKPPVDTIAQQQLITMTLAHASAVAQCVASHEVYVEPYCLVYNATYAVLRRQEIIGRDVADLVFRRQT